MPKANGSNKRCFVKADPENKEYYEKNLKTMSKA